MYKYDVCHVSVAGIHLFKRCTCDVCTAATDYLFLLQKMDVEKIKPLLRAVVQSNKGGVTAHRFNGEKVILRSRHDQVL